mmetsp:Transcript_26825/g.53861  ORF Transcript_26825/g.53861 Transcript_26825/m.53861 type:complete len:958 (-) Transcript_26825:58-2931(-)
MSPQFNSSIKANPNKASNMDKECVNDSIVRKKEHPSDKGLEVGYDDEANKSIDDVRFLRNQTDGTQKNAPTIQEENQNEQRNKVFQPVTFKSNHDSQGEISTADSWENDFDITTDEYRHRVQVSSLGFTSQNFTEGLIESINEFNGDERSGSITIDDLDLDFQKMKRPSKIQCRETSGCSAISVDMEESTNRSGASNNNMNGTSPPNYAGGTVRRRGSLERRMQQRCGLGPGSNKGRGGPGKFMERKPSLRKSVADDESLAMSLASFTSASSMTSQPGGDNVTVGNLVFVRDEEMPAILNEDGNPDDDFVGGGGGKCEMEEEDNAYGYFPTQHMGSFIDYDDNSGNLPNLVRPSAILGQGSFATVRLAWRKTQTNLRQKLTKDLSGINEEEESNPSYGGTGGNYTQQHKRNRSEVIVGDWDQNDGTQDKGDLVAVKIIQKSILKQMKTMHKDSKNNLTVRTAFDNIEREIATMKRLRHPNLVRLFEVIDSEESDKLYMVLEFVSLGEILSYVEGTNRYERKRMKSKVKGLTPGGYFDEEHAALYFVDILHGLGYLHRHHICHRDLKPENILLGANGVAKISDFGVAHMFENERGPAFRASGASHDDDINDFLSDYDSDEDVNGNSEMELDNSTDPQTRLLREDTDSALIMSAMYNRGMLNKTEGTWCFWSPEMCNSDYEVFSGYAADMWAAGVCLYIFTTGKLPFFSLVPAELFDLIEKAEVHYDELKLSNTLKDILSMMLAKDPSFRAGVGDCLQHDFCKDARARRINEFGIEFEQSQGDIVLTNDEVHMALSITKMKSSVLSKIMEHFSSKHKMEAVTESDDAGSDDDKDGRVKNKTMTRRLSAETLVKRSSQENATLASFLPKPIRNVSGRRSTQTSQGSSEMRVGNGGHLPQMHALETFSTATDEEEKSLGLSCSTRRFDHVDSMDSDKKTTVRHKRLPKLKKVSSNAECTVQ